MPAALIHDPGQTDAAFLEHLPHDLAAVDAAGFFVVPQAEQNGALRAVALPEQRLGGVHDADQLVLDVQRAAAPDEAVDDHPVERRVGPLGRVGGADTTSWCAISITGSRSARLPCQV